jgi:hypothetical protein
VSQFFLCIGQEYALGKRQWYSPPHHYSLLFPLFLFLLSSLFSFPSSHDRLPSATGSHETVFHFDDITKGAMMGVMGYIYCGGFHSKFSHTLSYIHSLILYHRES